MFDLWNPVPRRKPLPLAAGAISAACVLVLAACGGGTDKSASGAATSGGGDTTKMSFTLDYLYDGLHAPFFAADKQGFYKNHGLDVAIEQGSGSSKSIQRVAANQVPVGLADASTVLQALSKNKLDLVVVGVLLRHSVEGVGVLASSGITSPGQLAGKTVANGSGTSGVVTFPAFLAATGVSPDAVKIQMVSPGSGNGLMYAGKVDGSVDYVQTFAQAPSKVTFLSYFDAGLKLYGSAIIANKTWLQSHGSAMTAFLQATGEGLQYTLKNPDKAASYVAEAAQRPPAYYQEEVKLLTSYWDLPSGTIFGSMDADVWSNMQDIFQQYGQISPVAPSDLYTEKYVK